MTLVATRPALSTVSIPSYRAIEARPVRPIADHFGPCAGHDPDFHMTAEDAEKRARAIGTWITAFRRDYPEFRLG